MTKDCFFRLPEKTSQNKQGLKRYLKKNYHPYFIAETEDYQITYLIVSTTEKMEKQAELFLQEVNPIFKQIEVSLEDWPTRAKRVKPYSDAALFAKFMPLALEYSEWVNAVIFLSETSDNLHYYSKVLKRVLQKVPLLSNLHLIVLSLESQSRNLEFEQALGKQWKISYLPCPHEFNQHTTTAIIAEMANISLNMALGLEAASRNRAYSI